MNQVNQTQEEEEEEQQEELLHLNEGVDPSNLVNVLGLMELTFGQSVGLLGLFVLAVVLGCSVNNAVLALTLYYYPDAGAGKQAWMCLVYAIILIIGFAFIEKLIGVNNRITKTATKQNKMKKKNKNTTIGTVRQ